MRYLLSLVVFSFMFLTTNAQTGKVSGTVMDGELNDVLPFANISVKNTSKGATTDFEGDFQLSLEPGTYDIVFSFVGYQTKEITGVIVKEGDNTFVNVTLSAAAGNLDEVIITTTARQNTEESVLRMQKNSNVLMDAISIETMKRSGASDIASAVKTVPGVSIQDGKYVFVRGLGDRYTKSVLNGMDIPGLDPDKNTIQMDIFPTSILENVNVSKSASADLQADFTGGVIDIITRDFPSKEEFTVSFSSEYNPDMHFQDSYLNYPGGNTDFLGFDDGTRELPVNPNVRIPNPASPDNQLTGPLTSRFNPQMATERNTSPMNFSLGLGYGNQWDVKDNKLGFIASLDYKNKTNFYENFENGIYQKNPDPSVNELRFDRRQIGDLGQNNVLLTGMTGLSYKTDYSKYKFNVLHIQNGLSQASLFDQDTQISNAISTVKDNLEYNERSITNFLLGGKHTRDDGNFTIDWSLSPSFVKADDKDVRLTTFIREANTLNISSDAGFPTRLWRELEEVNAVGKLDFTKKYSLLEKNSTLKFGGFFSYKQRDYAIYNYNVGFINTNPRDLNGDPNAILRSDNVYDADSNSGYFMRGAFQPSNAFDASQTVSAAYASNEFKIGDKLKSVIGLRLVDFRMYYTGVTTGGQAFDNEETLSKLDLFPSANFVYEYSDNTNFRLSYARTTARPSFKEKSNVQIVDLLTGIIYLGNLDVEPSYIDNFDLRYEFYGDQAQMFALSGFYKRFNDPIELVAFNVNAPNQFTPRNSDFAEVFGIEFEARKNFNFIAESLKDLSLNFNISFIESRIEMNKGAGQEFESRQAFAREGEVIDDTRELQGQSPYLINAGLNYNNQEKGLEAGFFYNVQGETLQVVGFGLNPDVYIEPFHSLNFNFSQKFGKDQKSTISFGANNILNDDRESQYQSFGGQRELFEIRRPFRSFSLGYSYKF